mmetsp:Transcript_22490/g.41863  ORF Transcript_22490/g.41863 Transcript_22490/m.41863 type:complete len:80 (+) Transcript_22490:102-341(+)
MMRDGRMDRQTDKKRAGETRDRFARTRCKRNATTNNDQDFIASLAAAIVLQLLIQTMQCIHPRENGLRTETHLDHCSGS